MDQFQGQVSLLCSLLHDLSTNYYCDNHCISIQQWSLSHFTDLFPCVLAFIPFFLKPYEHQTLNVFDELILQLVVLATLIPLTDNVSQQLSTATIIIVFFLPLIFFIALELVVHKETIRTIPTKIIPYFKTESVSTNYEILIG